ncbi:2-amino-4-hydroxy-6-hydroxymethyldihydropteridine diphosphokinase [Amycolatopsis sp. AA4]|uniref:2-amino-4-hydroxy-6- hydroxymethyldihydropteridine diphosphokinase n=1 Tax=Actinomycetes TaxID=1760 RepID=UPI0001B5763D|nr:MULTISPECIES: 2-amino-4-hydroxy-6-hydroxymethyldihydropteridine diphosphokinase [Actinomycetes]ATY15261.1 2-amino-4-hydroxy-6-hydroxymethyldihydropteridine diphosphokinase [Amycolatopsis sp. AA4]EFL11496.1 7,8-dihydro-6-hydroxymethylpterin-pyrophosphokinase [Streptomyces sp. AA4]
MSRAVLSLGSNLGDRLGYLRSAVDAVRPALVAVSGVYETKAWGVEDQPDFLNALCVVDDPARDHWAWLRAGQAAEQAAGRVRELRWGPRTLDVDVVTVQGVTSDDPELLLPHPGTPDRASVLIPWLEIDPDAEVPGRGRAADLLARLPEADRAGVVLRPDLTLS